MAPGDAGGFGPGPGRPERGLFESPKLSGAYEIFLSSTEGRGRAAAAVEKARRPVRKPERGFLFALSSVEGTSCPTQKAQLQMP